MLSVFEAGEASFRLADAHQENVGWIRGAAIGFDGFATEADALSAAVAGRDALDGFLQRLTGAVVRADAPTGGRVSLRDDGAHEWVTRGATPVARLYRPEHALPQRGRRRAFAVEFVLPSYVKEGAAISASQVLYNAIARPAAPRSAAQAVPLSLGGSSSAAQAAGAP